MAINNPLLAMPIGVGLSPLTARALAARDAALEQARQILASVGPMKIAAANARGEMVTGAAAEQARMIQSGLESAGRGIGGGLARRGEYQAEEARQKREQDWRSELARLEREKDIEVANIREQSEAGRRTRELGYGGQLDQQMAEYLNAVGGLADQAGPPPPMPPLLRNIYADWKDQNPEGTLDEFHQDLGAGRLSGKSREERRRRSPDETALDRASMTKHVLLSEKSGSAEKVSSVANLIADHASLAAKTTDPAARRTLDETVANADDYLSPEERVQLKALLDQRAQAAVRERAAVDQLVQAEARAAAERETSARMTRYAQPVFGRADLVENWIDDYLRRQGPAAGPGLSRFPILVPPLWMR